MASTQSVIKFTLVVFFVLITDCFSQEQSNQNLFEIEVSKNLLGTLVEAKVVHTDINFSKKALYQAFKEIERIDSTYSLQNNNSLTNKINMNSGLQPVKVTLEAFQLIQRSVEYSKKYEGLFDITVGPLTDLWGFSSDSDIKLPNVDTINSLLQLIGSDKIEMNEKDTTIFLNEKGMKIDLGGIAKGFAVDVASKKLKEFGIKNFMLNAGGDIYVSGKNKNQKPWHLGIKHPRKDEEIIAEFEASDIAVATSGDYERYSIIDGRRYHHILVPSTGMPGNLSQSVTLLFNNTEEATVIGKYIFLIGLDSFLKSPLSKSINYYIIDNAGHIFWNKYLEEYYKLKQN